MPKFALEKIEAVDGIQVFHKLIINGKCQFDEFEEEIKSSKRYLSELVSIYQYMQRIANNEGLPKTKFNTLSKKGDKVKEYEFKTKHLRVYVIKQENGKIIILGGYKNRQKRDLAKFRSIKHQFLKKN